MEYGRIVKRALDITWHHRVLWIFGIAAALFGAGNAGMRGGGNGMQYVLNGSDIERWRRGIPMLPFLPRTSWGWGHLFPGSGIFPMLLGILAILLLVVLVLSILGILVRYTSLGALMGMVNEIEDVEHTSFGSGLRKGWGRFLRLFAINLLIEIVSFVVFLPAILLVIVGVLIALLPGIALVSSGNSASVLGVIWMIGIGVVAVLLFVAVTVVMSVLVTLVRELAFRACVIDQQGVFDALKTGIALLRKQAREVVPMWLLLFGIRIALSLVTIPLVLIGVGAFLGPVLLVLRTTQFMPAAIIVAIPFLLIFVATSALFGGVYLTFHSAVWTLTYRELGHKQKLLQSA
jgi:hypothetical protein